MNGSMVVWALAAILATVNISMTESVNASVDEVKQYFGADYIAQEKKREKAAALILESAVVGEAPAAEEPAAEEKGE